MMTATTSHAAADTEDAVQAKRSLERRGLHLIDPFADPPQRADPYMTGSLETARFIFRQSAGSVDASGRRFRGYPCFVGRPTANAFAVEDAGLQLCGVEVGLVTATFEMGLFVFSQAALFTEIGDAAAEQSPDLPAGTRLAFSIADRLRVSPKPATPVGQDLIPRGVPRQHAAQYLTQLLLRFTWLHELYHCLNGHTGLLASRRPGVVLNEMPDEAAPGLVERDAPADGGLPRRVRHAMEFDADRSAIWMLIRMQQVDLEPIDVVAAWPKVLRLKLAIFAGVLMTFLFDQAARRSATETSVTHPHARDRLVDLVRTMASHLQDPPGEVQGAFRAVLAEMTALHKRLPQFVSGEQLRADVGSPTLQRELDEIDDALTAARASFAPWAYRAPSSAEHDTVA